MADPNTREPDCSEAGRVLAYLRQELSPREAEEFEAHYFACDHCWEEVERGLEIRAALADEAAELGAEAPAPVVVSMRWRPYALAAAAMLALFAVGLWMWTPGPSEHPEGMIFRGGEELLAVESALTSDGMTARWSAISDAESYVIQLLAADGELLYEREIGETSLQLPRESLPAGEPGEATLFLKVQALDALRQVLASSGLEEVTIARPDS